MLEHRRKPDSANQSLLNGKAADSCAGGIVLCGGRSRRMGATKANLPFAGETMLARVVRLLLESVAPVVVVRGPEQDLGPLPPVVNVVCDRQPNRGPLEGLAVGLAALAGRADAAFVTACDTPLLKPALVRRMLSLAAGFEAAVPCVGERAEPLAAVYSVSVLPKVEALLAADRLRPIYLLESVHAKRVDANVLRDVDPRLDSLRSVNTPEQYRWALDQLNLEPTTGRSP